MRRCLPQVPLQLMTASHLPPLSLYIYSVFCRSPTRGQDGERPSSSYCACCKVSPKRSPNAELARPDPSLPGCRDPCQAPRRHSALPQQFGLIHGFLSWDLRPCSGSREWSDLGPGGVREVRAHRRGRMPDLLISRMFTVLVAPIFHFILFKLMTESQLHL